MRVLSAIERKILIVLAFETSRCCLVGCACAALTAASVSDADLARSLLPYPRLYARMVTSQRARATRQDLILAASEVETANALCDQWRADEDAATRENARLQVT